MAVSSGKGASIRISANTKDAEREINGLSKKMHKFSGDAKGHLGAIGKTGTKSFKDIAKEVAVFQGAVTGAVMVAVNEFKKVETVALNIQYLFEDMGKAGRQAMIDVAEETARTAGVSLETATQIQGGVRGGWIHPPTSWSARFPSRRFR